MKGRENMLFGTAKMNRENHLEVGGCDTVKLAQKFGTPLFVYDVAHIRAQARGFKQTLNQLGIKNKVVYASKAFSCLAIYQVLKEEDIACDVVSGGELFTALKGGMEPAEIEFHGNNKTPEELRYALDNKIGTIVIDNFYEIDLLEELLATRNQTQKVLFRVSPGVDAETHDYILTGQEDSKFGFDVASGQATEALVRLLSNPSFDVQGVHCHIGSQIFAVEGFLAAVEKMFTILEDWRQVHQFTARVLNMGGGFGVQYTQQDEPLAPATFVEKIVYSLKGHCEQLGYPLPELWIEPGRSLIAEAGTTIYTVGAQKEVPGVRHFVSVDGGMGDNIRPALYQAVYDGFLANREGHDSVKKVTVVGKYCESGDVLLRDILLPEVKAGDLLAISSTGAYGYSMASNYNRNPRPAVVFVEDGQAKLVARRETYEDMTTLDC
ncbi:diaminopimelate decarboxylase [Enterococcus faecalis]|uniref:diaminopimelate decarboxylase n=1 Tax=Enterococcus TaxID=1350 RepID=UPI001386AA47|nr:diaminopimelate decarboxylase [Enterococcus faecalis]EGO2609952.1 diaminopimelate decarboxylase [Enterococcus faecalis]EGO5091984.1 diaminopimelate decarboxylase [Enterococcus faecalis]EGO5145004.1 diaminopimelate decarboxylase [Enterococcus faecalis]EGO5155907.1 diaminopimelate decarboxylase [Enterococcus faecalis]EGO6537643.1 diaminopimelate decarboxylase [Enterococcus faecalis]